MILILTQDHDDAATMVQRHLEQKRVPFFRVDPGKFPSEARLSCRYDRAGLRGQVIYWEGKRIDLKSVSSIWYRRPARPVAPEQLRDQPMRAWVEREARAFVEGLWISLDCFWVSQPRRIQDAENKPYHLKIASELGFSIPNTLMGNDSDAFLDFYNECAGDVICKPILFGSVSYGEDLYQVYTNRVRRCDLGFVRSIAHAPVIFQEYIPKKVEIRVTVVGNLVFAAEIHSQCSARSKVDWRRYDIEHTTYDVHELPGDVAYRCGRLVKTMGLNYGTIDLILTPEDTYVFLELNPNGQWGWVEFLTGTPISEAIADLLINGRTDPSLEVRNESAIVQE